MHQFASLREALGVSMDQDTLKAEVMEGAARLGGVDPGGCRLIIRELLGRPEPAAEIWAELAEHERRGLLIFTGAPSWLARRQWQHLRKESRAAIREAISAMAQRATRLQAELSAVRGVGA